MNQPDFEHYHRLKGRIEDSIEDMPEDSTLRAAALNHLRKSETRLSKAIGVAIQDSMDDMYYIKEVMESAS